MLRIVVHFVAFLAAVSVLLQQPAGSRAPILVALIMWAATVLIAKEGEGGWRAAMDLALVGLVAASGSAAWFGPSSLGNVLLGLSSGCIAIGATYAAASRKLHGWPWQGSSDPGADNG
jgi:hypothetical protein